MKNYIKIFILLCEVLIIYIIISKINIGCIFLKIFNIYCPSCGLTRAFREIINFNFIKAFRYNILSIPIFIFILILNIFIVYDLLFNKDITYKYIRKVFSFYKIIIILIITSFIYNNTLNFKEEYEETSHNNINNSYINSYINK